MKRFKWLAVTAGMAALAACSGGDETNTTNADMNLTDENLMLPPVDMNTDMNADMNMSTDMNADMNAVDTNAADNTTNSY